MAKSFDDCLKSHDNKIKGKDLSDYADWLSEIPLLGQGLTKGREKFPNKGNLTVTFFYEDGAFKCSLSAKDQGWVSFVTIDDMRSPWAQIEALIESDELHWKESRPWRR